MQALVFQNTDELNIKFLLRVESSSSYISWRLQLEEHINFAAFMLLQTNQFGVGS